MTLDKQRIMAHGIMKQILLTELAEIQSETKDNFPEFLRTTQEQTMELIGGECGLPYTSDEVRAFLCAMVDRPIPEASKL